MMLVYLRTWINFVFNNQMLDIQQSFENKSIINDEKMFPGHLA
jgi:hypothetical protein